MKKGTRTGLIVLAVIAGVAAVLALLPVLLHRAPAKQDAVTAPKPATAFTVGDGVLPEGWKIANRSATYLTLANPNGCVTTSTLAVSADYQNLQSVGAFEKSFAVKFENSGYGVNNVAAHTLGVNVSGATARVNGIYYELTANSQTTYHVDAGVKGRASLAFDGLSCPSADDLPAAQAALLRVTYDDAYLPAAQPEN